MTTASLVESASKGDYSKFAAIARKEGMTKEYLKDSRLWQRYKDKYLTKSDESPEFKRLIDDMKKRLMELKMSRQSLSKRIDKLQSLAANFEEKLNRYDRSKLKKFRDDRDVNTLYYLSSANMPTATGLKNLIDDIVKLCDKL
jgi:chromosome segregation ATPase